MVSMKIGVLFRSYAKKPDGVDEVVWRAIESTRKASAAGIDRIIFIVPTDCDCGFTASRLRDALATEGIGEVLEASGNQNSEVLNQGLKVLQADGIKYAAIVSNKAAGYLNKKVLEMATTLLFGGMFAAGLQIQELEDVQEIPVSNTCAFWDVDKLLHVGGFDSLIGVEEITALSRLILEYCVSPGAAIIVGNSDGKLDIRKSDEGQAHHATVKETKRARQESEAARVGVTLPWVWEGIMIV